MRSPMYYLQILALNIIVARVLNAPEKQFPKLLKWAERFDKFKEQTHVTEGIKPILSDPENIWNQYIVDLCRDVDHGVLKTVVRNFVINASFAGKHKQESNRKKYGCNIPWAVLMDPTSACNLKCIGCWAAEYGSHMNMSYGELDSIIRQANDLGTYLFLYSGGEPLVRKHDIIRLCRGASGQHVHGVHQRHADRRGFRQGNGAGEKLRPHHQRGRV